MYRIWSETKFPWKQFSLKKKCVLQLIGGIISPEQLIDFIVVKLGKEGVFIDKNRFKSKLLKELT